MEEGIIETVMKKFTDEQSKTLKQGRHWTRQHTTTYQIQT
jgi:hypothetical protein